MGKNAPCPTSTSHAQILRGETARFPRDRLGIVPILYAPGEGCVVVGETYGALFASGVVPKRWRREALEDFLATGAVVFPEGKTFFEGVFEVPPGHDILVSGSKAVVVPGHFLPEASENLGEEALPILRERIIEALGESLDDAALSLSGGLDSTALAAAWARRTPPPCFLYDGTDPSEGDRARATAHALGTSPSVSTSSGPASLEELRTMLRILEIPSHIPGGPLPQYRLLEAMARHGIHTVLSGQGGDELFCGYPWHFPLAMTKLRGTDPEKALALEALHDEHPPFGPLDLRLCRRSFTRTSSWVTLNDGGACQALGFSREDVMGREGVRFFAADLACWDDLRLHALTRRSLPFLLHYDHRLTRHFGLEGRAPLLADGVVDLVSRFRLDFLYWGGWLKYPLRRLFPEIPEAVRFHPRKTGFWHSSPALPDLRPEIRRMGQHSALGDLLIHPEAVDTMAPGALWRFFAVGTLLEGALEEIPSSLRRTQDRGPKRSVMKGP